LKPAIVVVAYNRPRALGRLLDSLSRAIYPEDSGGVSLIIASDRGEDAGAREVAALADGFRWRFGPKEVIKQVSHLGLVRHFRECGRLALKHGAVILLEDDLAVAPPFYDFTAQVLERCEVEPRIGGVCLYGLWFNGFTQEPFLPIEDGSDVFFLRLPYTQGLAFTAAQWQSFEDWSQRTERGPHPDLPEAFLRFGPDEWFPELAYYLVSSGKFFCFPRVSLIVGWGDEGTHFSGRTSWLQTPLQIGTRPSQQLKTLDDAFAVYDAFYEILSARLRTLAPALPDVDFDVDLNAIKKPFNLHSDYVLTMRPVQKALTSFGLRMYPPEMNVIEAVPGSEIALARREDVYWDAWAELEARRRLHAYAWARRRPSRRQTAAFLAANLVQAFRRWRDRLAREGPVD